MQVLFIFGLEMLRYLVVTCYATRYMFQSLFRNTGFDLNSHVNRLLVIALETHFKIALATIQPPRQLVGESTSAFTNMASSARSAAENN